MQICIEAPLYCRTEIEYSLNLLFSDFLGLEFTLVFSDRDSFLITQAGNEARLLLVADFFKKLQTAWLSPDCLPGPVTTVQAPNDTLLPILFGAPEITREANSVTVGFDIVGTVFFMVSRLEEAIVDTRDDHDRFPAHASVAAQHGFLHRPIVDEYADCLWEILHSLFPVLRRREKRGQLFISCDLDWPFDPTLYSLKLAARAAGRLLLQDRSPRRALGTCRDYLLTRLTDRPDRDNWYQNVGWIMDQNEKLDQQVTFFVIPHKTGQFDPDITLSDSKTRALLREIHARGHEIGIHPGYGCSVSMDILEQSVRMFFDALKEEGILQSAHGCRMHYLRWNALTSPGMLDRLGLAYDSTLGYADAAGFRCGTAQEFPMYDLAERRSLSLRQRPLVAMESTIIADRYEGLGYSPAALDRFLALRGQCLKHKGLYTFLWHNTHFQHQVDRDFYQIIINRDLSGANLAEAGA